jgi:hypothetical protein
MTESNATAPWSGAPPAAVRNAMSGTREKARRHAVNITILIYLIIVLDGIARKYLLPELQRPLLFMRDPFVLYLYAHAMTHGFIKKSGFLAAALVLFFVTLVVIVPQSISSADSLIFVAYGLRQYFLIIPLAFVIADIFHHEDLQRFFRINMILMVLMAPLMLLQVLSPPGAWINVGGAGNIDLQFGNNAFGEFVRAPGFFTSAVGTAIFMPFIAAVLLFSWSVPRRERPASALLLFAATFALMVAIAMSGSRGAIVGVLLVAGAGVLSAFVMPGRKSTSRAAGASIFIAVAATATFFFLFPDQFSALNERWVGANEDEGNLAIVWRAFGDFTAFFPLVTVTPLTGIGLGMGSNAANILVVNPSANLTDILNMIESDWSRQIVDLGPVIGIFYIILRITLAIDLGLIAIKNAVRYADPRPWFIASAVGIQLLDGLITGQSTANGLVWFYVGLILAAPRYRRAYS